MPAGNGQDRGIYPDLKGRPRGTGIPKQRWEVYLWKYVVQRRRTARSILTRNSP